MEGFSEIHAFLEVYWQYACSKRTINTTNDQFLHTQERHPMSNIETTELPYISNFPRNLQQDPLNGPLNLSI